LAFGSYLEGFLWVIAIGLLCVTFPTSPPSPLSLHTTAHRERGNSVLQKTKHQKAPLSWKGVWGGRRGDGGEVGTT